VRESVDMSDARVTGLSELRRLLDELPAKLERNVMRGALRAGVKTILPVAKQNIHSVSGELAEGLKIGTRARDGVVTAYVKATGPHRSIAHLVEHGTRAHFIAAKDGGALAIGAGLYESVHHPGAAPHPFARPATDQQAVPAAVAAGNYMKDRLATKHGIDTAHIMVEGDEA
jgi:hypothetical protein